jgi:hypothetical protein
VCLHYVERGFFSIMTLSLVETTPDDLKASWEIYTHFFGDEGVGKQEDCLALLRCRYSCWSLKEDKQVVGGFSLFHLSPSFLNDILTNCRTDDEITVDDVLPFEGNSPFSLYIAMAAIDPRLPAHLNKFYAGRLSASFAAVILTLRDMGYLIDAIYGLAVTADGERVAGKLGFAPLIGVPCAPQTLSCRYLLDERGIQRLQRLRRLAPQLSLTEVAGVRR